MSTSFLATNIAALRRHLGLNQTDFADAVGGKQPAVSKWESGADEPGARALGRIADLAGCSVDTFYDHLWRPTGNAPAAITVPDTPPTRGSADDDGTIWLKRINLGFAMGDGSNLDDIVEEGLIGFDPNLVRLISTSPSHRLFVADGVGDSMFPTLSDHDMIVIDTMQNELNKWDRIWAVAIRGAGAVKRIGLADAGKVEIISDSPIVDNKIVSVEDVRIIGRVVWSGRRH